MCGDVEQIQDHDRASESVLSNERFLRYVKGTLLLEGAWSDDASDPGGATMWGLTERFNPEIRDEIRNRTLTKERALEIIYRKYYEPLELIDKVDESIGFLVFDSKFHGMVEVVKELQSLIERYTGRRVVADGVWGRHTASTCMLLSKRDVSMILNDLSKKTFELGNKAAIRVINYQKRHNLEVYDYTAGFSNRQLGRLDYARSFVV